MSKQLHIIEGFIILIIIFIACLIIIPFIYNIKHEKVDESYMFDINFNNLQIKEGSKEADISLVDNVVNLDVILEKEEDFYEFHLDIANTGTLDAKLISITSDIDNPKGILTYKLTYLDDTEIKLNDIISSKETKTIKVRIEYPKQENKVYEKLELKLSLLLEYQAVYN